MWSSITDLQLLWQILPVLCCLWSSSDFQACWDSLGFTASQLTDRALRPRTNYNNYCGIVHHTSRATVKVSNPSYMALGLQVLAKGYLNPRWYWQRILPFPGIYNQVKCTSAGLYMGPQRCFGRKAPFRRPRTDGRHTVIYNANKHTVTRVVLFWTRRREWICKIGI